MPEADATRPVTTDTSSLRRTRRSTIDAALAAMPTPRDTARGSAYSASLIPPRPTAPPFPNYRMQSLEGTTTRPLTQRTRGLCSRTFKSHPAKRKHGFMRDFEIQQSWLVFRGFRQALPSESQKWPHLPCLLTISQRELAQYVTFAEEPSGDTSKPSKNLPDLHFEACSREIRLWV